MRSLTDMAADLGVSTEQVLTTLRVVASRAGIDELAAWATKELEGYGEKDELPTHRRWQLTIVADLYNPYQAFVPQAHVPIAEKYRRTAATYCCREGVGQLEDGLGDKLGNSVTGVEHPNLAEIVGASLQPGWTCVRAHAEFSSMHLREIVNRSRQTALTFCLKCEKKGITLQYYGADDDSRTASEERKMWSDLLRQESTKLALKDIWVVLRDNLFTGS